MNTIVRCSLATATLLSLLPFGMTFAQERAPEKPEVRLVVQTGQATAIANECAGAMAFSPDGKRILTGDGDGTARIWDVQTGKELHALRAHANPIHVVAFSGDGKRFLTGGNDGLVRLWDARTGKELLTLRFQGLNRPVSSVAFSPDDKKLLTANGLQGTRIWDAQSGKELLALKGANSQAAFSPDGKYILTGHAGKNDKTAKLWDAQTGAEVRIFNGHRGGVYSVAFSGDGKRILTGSDDMSARVWDAHNGKELLVLSCEREFVRSVVFSPDGKCILIGSVFGPTRLLDAQTGKELLSFKLDSPSPVFAPDGKSILSGGNTPRIWDVQTGKELQVFKGSAEKVRSVAFSLDGKRILISSAGSSGSVIRLWDTQTGRQQIALKGPWKRLTAAAISPDGRRVATADAAAGAQVWDAQTGKELIALGRNLFVVAFSPDGKRILTGSADKTARLWDAETGKELLVLNGHKAAVFSVAFTPDGKRIVTGSSDKSARLWDAETGKELRVLDGHTAVVFAPDGKRFLTGGAKARLWEAETGKELLAKNSSIWNSENVVAFTPDGKLFLTGGGYTVKLWDVETGDNRGALVGHTGGLTSVSFSADGKYILTGSTDHTARLWNAQTRKEICQLVSFEDGNWAVVDAAGRYDASNGGDVDGLHWVVGDEPIALKQLKERYYDPGLLAKHLGINSEPLREVKSFQEVKLHPDVSVVMADRNRSVFDVTLTNRGGGIGRTVVLVNGKELTDDARPRRVGDANAVKLDLKLDLSNDPRIVPGQKNTIEVLAYNAEGYLSSRGLVRQFDAPGDTAKNKYEPALHAVVVGVSKYRNVKLDLRYAAKDAEDFAKALELAAKGLFIGKDRVKVNILTTSSPNTRPTRAALEKALGALATARPDDVVVVYLAGHGVTQGGQDGDWYYLTADALSAEMADPVVRKQNTLSSAELTDLLKASPARKQVLILDTCHSGRVIEKLTEKRDVPGSQIRALERIKDRTGMHVLAGCAADSVSYEASRYGQGILTYSLLLGMRGAKLRENEYVDIVDLFSFAADKVPELARDIGGVQRPTIASPRGSSFDIGRLTASDRSKVPLQSVKPVVIRSSFQEEKRARDGLGLTKRINERLREASASLRGAKLVFVDAEEFPGAVQVAGRYKVDGEKATVGVSLFEGDKELLTFTVEGAAGKPDDLAEKIVAEIEKRLSLSISK